MSPELDNKLCEEFPLIFQDRRGNSQQTNMCWGFDCRDGWYDLIRILCLLIQNEINSSNVARNFDIKWNNRIKADAESAVYWDGSPHKKRRLTKIIPQIKASQVKEKFGTLRFYTNFSISELDPYINMAEYMSSIICEECGSKGRLRYGGWIKTLCDHHAREFGYEVDESVAL